MTTWDRPTTWKTANATSRTEIVKVPRLWVPTPRETALHAERESSGLSTTEVVLISLTTDATRLLRRSGQPWELPRHE